VLATVLWTFAVVLAIFGVVFAFLGLNSERTYWSQRDPSGNPRKDATKLRVIIAKCWVYAAGEVRAPLRIASIGIIMCWIAVGFAVVALIVTLLT